jgi:anti-sigma factor RsiW
MTDEQRQPGDRPAPSEAELRDLAALADGSLPAGRRAEVEARVAASPLLSDELARQRRALVAIRTAGAEVPAPASLRARVAAIGGAAAETPEARPAPTTRRRRAGWAGLAAAGAAAAVLALVVLPGGEPSIEDAAELTALPPSEPAPAQREEQPTLLAASFEGLSYPDWESEFGWRAVGERSDEIEGRSTNTVFYENPDGRRIGYTIVSGDALDPPANGEPSTRDGVELESFAADGSTAVTWLRGGHTCVLAGEGVERSTLLELAAWKGDGAVTF